MVVEATDAPSRNDGGETFTVATWNIRCGRNGGLESALRALESLEVDIAILTEAKLTKGIYTRGGRGYQVLATDAASAHQGGVALCHRQSDHFEVEETRTHGPNVISFHLMTGDTRYYVVGAYVPPLRPRDTRPHTGCMEAVPGGELANPTGRFKNQPPVSKGRAARDYR